MRKQEVHGKVKNVAGRLKEAAGILTGNRALEDAGTRDRVEGAVEAGVGKARRKTSAMLSGVAKAIKR